MELFFSPLSVFQKSTSNLHPLSNSLHLRKGMHVTTKVATGDLVRAKGNWRNNRITCVANFHQAGEEWWSQLSPHFSSRGSLGSAVTIMASIGIVRVLDPILIWWVWFPTQAGRPAIQLNSDSVRFYLETASDSTGEELSPTRLPSQHFGCQWQAHVVTWPSDLLAIDWRSQRHPLLGFDWFC